MNAANFLKIEYRYAPVRRLYFEFW